MLKKCNNYKSFIIDVIRITSSFAVFMIHYIAVLESRFSVKDEILSSIKYWAGLAVPIFFILSGYCIFNKRRKYKDMFQKIIKLLVLLFITNTLSLFFDKIFESGSSNILNIFVSSIRETLFLNLVTHLWFVPCLICLYIFSPVFTMLENDDLYIFTIFIIIFSEFKSYIPFFKDINFNIDLPYYFAYFLCGGLICRKIFDLKIILISLIVLLINIIFKTNFIGYESPLFFFLSITVFYYLLSIKNDKNNFINLRDFGVGTLYVYLFHPFFIHLFFDVLKYNTFMNNNYFLFLLAGLIIFLSTLFIFTFIYKAILSKIKF